GLGFELDEVLDAEVRGADGADPALVPQLDERLPGLDGETLGGGGPVDEVEVDLLEAEIGHGRVEGGEGRVAALVLVGDLGGDEDVVPGEAGRLQGRADPGFVVVAAGGVDVAVSGFEGLHDHVGRDLVLDLPHAVAELRDRTAVMEGDAGRGGHDAPCSRNAWPAGVLRAGRGRAPRCVLPRLAVQPLLTPRETGRSLGSEASQRARAGGRTVYSSSRSSGSQAVPTCRASGSVPSPGSSPSARPHQ